MDVALGQQYYYGILKHQLVLILVVMDVALGPSVEHMEGMFAKSVLILVVMDVALGRFLRK